MSSQLNKTLGQQTGNAKAHLDSALSKQTVEIHHLFSDDLQSLVKQISIIKQKVKNNPLQLKKFLVQRIKPLQNDLMIGQQNQRAQNKASQQIMTQIKRQNKQTDQIIIKTFQKLKLMESKVGKYE